MSLLTGQEKEALRLMSAYLTDDSAVGAGVQYTEGGRLYALGLIHSNHGGPMIGTSFFMQCALLHFSCSELLPDAMCIPSTLPKSKIVF